MYEGDIASTTYPTVVFITVISTEEELTSSFTIGYSYDAAEAVTSTDGQEAEWKSMSKLFLILLAPILIVLMIPSILCCIFCCCRRKGEFDEVTGAEPSNEKA